MRFTLCVCYTNVGCFMSRNRTSDIEDIESMVDTINLCVCVCVCVCVCEPMYLQHTKIYGFLMEGLFWGLGLKLCKQAVALPISHSNTLRLGTVTRLPPILPGIFLPGQIRPGSCSNVTR